MTKSTTVQLVYDFLDNYPENQAIWSINVKLHRKKVLNLFILAYSHYIHSSPDGKVLLCIIYTIQLIAIGLVEIVKGLRISQLVFLDFLH